MVKWRMPFVMLPFITQIYFYTRRLAEATKKISFSSLWVVSSREETEQNCHQLFRVEKEWSPRHAVNIFILYFYQVISLFSLVGWKSKVYKPFQISRQLLVFCRSFTPPSQYSSLFPGDCLNCILIHLIVQVSQLIK